MANLHKAISAQSAVDLATAITALNVTLVADQTAHLPGGINVQGFATGVAVGPIFTVAVVYQTFS